MAQQDSIHSFSHPDHEHKSEPENREMAQQQQQDIISHFSHPGHELVKRHYTGPTFRCDMCLEHLSSGPGYGCLAGCNFCIHDSCAGHPQKLSSPEHHAHPLVLVQTRHDATLLCDICIGSCAPGCFLYRCPPCGFDMHPACVRLPRVVRSSRHPEHDLTLVVGDGSCAACNHSAGRPFYYRCTTCRVDFHVSCAATLGDNSSAGAHHQAGQDVNSQVQQARAAHLQSLALQAELLGARFRQKGMNAALDLLSPASYPDSTVVRREYFF